MPPTEVPWPVVESGAELAEAVRVYLHDHGMWARFGRCEPDEGPLFRALAVWDEAAARARPRPQSRARDTGPRPLPSVGP